MSKKKFRLNKHHEGTIASLRIKFIVVFLLLLVGTYYSLDYMKKQVEQSYLNDSTKLYERAYGTTCNRHKELADVVFSGLLNLINVDEQLFNVEKKSLKEQFKTRNAIYLQTINRFKNLKTKGIKSINYILPSDKIFLRMDHPELLNTPIEKNSQLIKFVKKYRKPIFGYEICKNMSGYKFLYPLIKDNIYVGAVSITFSEDSFTSEIMSQYYVLSNFIIKETKDNKNILKDSNNYVKSHMEGYLYPVGVLNKLIKVTKDISKIKTSIKNSKKILQKAFNKKATSMYIKDMHFITTTIPIFDRITQKQVASLIIKSDNKEVRNLNKNYRIILFLIIFLYALVLIIFYLEILKRINEKENLEQIMLKDRQLFEQAKKAQMGEMIANIAHQWRQPLSSISTIASGLKINYEYNLLDYKEIPEYMDAIVKNTQYLSKTIDTFNAFSKKEKLTKEIIVQEKIQEALDIVNLSLVDSHIKLRKNIRPKEPIKMVMIPDALGQVIINILNNSKDAISEKMIENPWIKLNIFTKNETLIITISDNAGGIDEEIISRIFEPYFTTKFKTEGIGLGLYMSLNIVEKYLDGTIEVKNTKVGAKFIVKIPLDQRGGGEMD